ncbi:hypothetical protein SETIT_2G069300v2 [Setaria italica]|uniref:KIB1-4 beta-propeller domain-containing protein n=1 Tax=Setaria italica TaxID=4555 RepID=K4A2S2_SETIT|nr:hypothetical protein SETIT_2G069300v2 [Setaria italica]
MTSSQTTLPSTLSTQKRSRHGWTSLPYDIVRSKAGRFLADDDIDYYMAFRATCPDWRSATKDYPEKADYTDATRFQPSKWVLLHQRDDLVTLVNVDTGRFLCKSIPLLREHFFVGATGGGLILLGDSTEPSRARLLNPFTGSIAHFKVPVPVAGVRAVAVTTAPLMVFVSTHHGDILWADQNSECFKSFRPSYSNRPTCLTPFAGKVYATDQQGSVISSAVAGAAAGEQRLRSALMISMDTTIPGLDTSPDTSYLAWTKTGKYYLVESGGGLLLVTRASCFDTNLPVVHRVDTERKVLEPVSSIGNRAIFAGPVKCLSVDADKFQGIKGGCIYFVEPEIIRGRDYEPSSMTVFHVATRGWQDSITFGWSTPKGCFHPFTLIQALADYCRSAHYSELFEIDAREWGWDISSDSESDESSDDDDAYPSEPDDV